MDHVSENGSTLKCTICKDTLESQPQLWQHAKEVHKDLKVNCHLCSAELLGRQRLALHLKALHSIFYCDICDITFEEKASLTLHANAYHIKKQTFLCDHCGMNFTSK